MPDFIRPWDQNIVLLEYGQHHPERESIEKVKLMGHCCTPHLHLDLTGRAHVLFKVKTDSTFVLFSKEYFDTLDSQHLCLLHDEEICDFCFSNNIFQTSIFSLAAKAHIEPDNGCD